MIKLIPYLAAFAVGFFASRFLFRFTGTTASVGWEHKYREIFQRYRDLTQRFESIDRAADLKAARLRKSLIDVAAILRGSDGVAPDRAAAAIREIDAALGEG